jgi:hypothetical protein
MTLLIEGGGGGVWGADNLPWCLLLIDLHMKANPDGRQKPSSSRPNLLSGLLDPSQTPFSLTIDKLALAHRSVLRGKIMIAGIIMTANYMYTHIYLYIYIHMCILLTAKIVYTFQLL